MFQMILRLDQQVADPNDVGGFPLERDTKVLRDDRELAPLLLHISNFRLKAASHSARAFGLILPLIRSGIDSGAM